MKNGIDYLPWVQIDRWNCIEAACLLCGFNPKNFLWETLFNRPAPDPTQPYVNIKEYAEKAISKLEINAYTIKNILQMQETLEGISSFINPHGVHFKAHQCIKISIYKLIKEAKIRDITIPKSLLTLVKNRHQKQYGSSLFENKKKPSIPTTAIGDNHKHPHKKSGQKRMENNLIKVIAGLLPEIEQRKHKGLAKRVEKNIEMIDEPLSIDTIRAALKNAQALSAKK